MPVQRKPLIFVAAAFTFLGCVSVLVAADPPSNINTFGLPPLPSAAYGMAFGGGDKTLLAAGGLRQSPTETGLANLDPLADMYRLRENAEQWETFATADARAFAATVMHGGSLYSVGGLNKDGFLASVIHHEIFDGQAKTHELAALPAPLAFARAVVYDGTVWVFGGATSLDPLMLNDRIYTLSLAGLNGDWKSIPAPFPGRLLPVAAMHLGAIFVGGGWGLDETGDEDWVALSDFWRYRTEGSLSENPWKERAPANAPLGDAELFTVGQSHLMLVNVPVKTRVDKLADVFAADRQNLPVAISYHAITDAWFEFDKLPVAAGRTQATNWDVTERTGFKTMKRSVPVVLSVSPDAPQAQTTELQITFPKGKLHGLDYALMAVYVGIMVWLGLYYAKKEKNSEDFFVGGRRIPWWAAAISAQATGASAITMMAIPALIYKESVVYYGGLFLGIIPAVLCAIFLIPIIRRLGVVSIYQYLERRFGQSIRLLSASIYVLSQIVGRMGVVVMLPAMALSAVTGINVYVCIVTTGLVVMFYTTLGGISSVIWSDVIQFAIMVGGAILCVILILTRIDGGLNTFFEISTDYDKWRMFNFSLDFTVPVFWVMLLMSPLGAFGGISDQAFIQRIASVKDIKGAQKATVWNYLWALPLQTSMWVVGIALFVFFRRFPNTLDPTLGTDTVFPQFIASQLPAGLSGLMIVGILAAAMSSLDSSMNSVSTVIVTDFYRLINKTASEKQCLRLARTMTILTGLLGIASAIFIASLDLASGQEAFGRIMGLITGGFPGLFMLALLTRRGNSIGAFAGVLGASLAVFLIQKHTAVNWMLYGAIAFTTSITVGYLVSILTGGSRKDLTGLTVWEIRQKDAPIAPQEQKNHG